MPNKRSLETPLSHVTLGVGSPVCCAAHRGARAYAPENTLPAFEKAARLGCTMIELDVHMTRDGELVVHHDDRLGRCTDARARFPVGASDLLSDYELPQLQQLDAGSWYVQQIKSVPGDRQAFLRTLTPEEQERYLSSAEIALYAGGTVRIPTLAEALDVATRSDLMVNIEIKTIPRMYPGIAGKIVDLVVARGLQRSVVISSFDHFQLLEVRRLDETLLTGVLTSDRLAHPAGYLKLLDADSYNPGCYDDFDSLGFGSVSGTLDPRGIREVLGAMKMVFVWTCNEPQAMQALASERVTGLITDYPNRFHALAASAP